MEEEFQQMLSDGTDDNDFPITVLMVDDQEIIAKSVQRMLQDESDIQFRYCQNSVQAIQVAKSEKPSVILQDLVMPDLDGMTLIRYYRACKELEDVPIIVMSAKEEPEIKAKTFALGANDYIVKLPAKSELIARIRYHSKGYIALQQRNQAYRSLQVRNQFIREVFGRYVTEEVVNSIIGSPQGLEPGGKTQRISIMMSDLRGFTALSERLAPEDIVAILNNYLSAMTDTIVQFNGTIDEFTGDGILVFFGAPIWSEDHATKATACAIAMQKKMIEVNRWNNDRGFPKLDMGIGINTGEVVVGNIGSEKRMKYGAVGQNINLAARIESYTTGGMVLISEDTKKGVGDILNIKDVLEVMPKGINTPINIYDVIGIEGNHQLQLEHYEVKYTELENKIQVQFNIIKGDDIEDGFHTGVLTHLGNDNKQAQIMSESELPMYTNIVIGIRHHDGSFMEDKLYAKIGKKTETGHLGLSFTSVSETSASKIGNLAGAFSQGPEH